MPRLLVIAGSDSSAGAGLQADLKTAQRFGVYAQTAVTAVTVQDTGGVHAMMALPPEIVSSQIRAALNDIGADIVKIGMLANAAIGRRRGGRPADGNKHPGLVLDPVLVSTSGTPLLEPAGIEILKSHLLPVAALVTAGCNFPECEIAGGHPALRRTMPGSSEAAGAFASAGCGKASGAVQGAGMDRRGCHGARCPHPGRTRMCVNRK